MKIVNQLDKVYIHEDSKNTELAERIFSLFPKEKIEFVKEQPWMEANSQLSGNEFNRSKRNLFVTPFRGQFFKRCPGATQKKSLTCCNYHILNLGLQCNMNCSYCYLQSYLNTPIMTMYSNIEDAMSELIEMHKSNSDAPMRVGTGEVIDSLSMDEISLYSRKLIEQFRQFPKWVLEFKTKSNKVDQFLDLEHSGNVWVSWSINPQYIIEREEHGTASLTERLEAATRCLKKGFPISFHIDPLIWHPDWQKNYKELVDDLTTRFKPEDVTVISIGSLRFQPEQRHIMRERFGLNSFVTSAEVFSSEGGKMRYESNLRTSMYKFVVDLFKSHNSNWKTFLCMETPESWIQAYNKMPMQVEGLRSFFKPISSN